jgi:hypothetical protein
LQDKLLPYILLIFSPFIFNFQAFDSSGGFRKEIIFLAILSLVVYWAKTKINFNKYFFIVLCLYPFAILSHEMIFFFMPYLYIAYFYVNDGEQKELKKLILFSLLSFIIFFVVLLFGKGDAVDVTHILNSLSTIGYSITYPDNAIIYLDKNIFYGFNMLQDRFFRQHFYAYPVLILFASVAFFPIKKKVLAIFNNKLFLFLLLSSMAMSLSLFLFAVDWGRWIYTHLFSIFLITLLMNNACHAYDKHFMVFKILLNKTNGLVIFLLIYSFVWYIPHVGSPLAFIPRNLKQLCILRYTKPFIFIAFHYNPLLKESCKEILDYALIVKLK